MLNRFRKNIVHTISTSLQKIGDNTCNKIVLDNNKLKEEYANKGLLKNGSFLTASVRNFNIAADYFVEEVFIEIKKLSRNLSKSELKEVEKIVLNIHNDIFNFYRILNKNTENSLTNDITLQSIFKEQASNISEKFRLLPYSKENSNLNRVDKFVFWFKNHPFLSLIVIVSISIIAISDLKGAVIDLYGTGKNLFVNKVNVENTLIVIIKVTNKRKEDIRLAPFCKYGLSEEIGISLTEYPGGRLSLIKILNKEKDYLLIKKGEAAFYKAVFPNPDIYKTLLDRGGADLSIILYDTKGDFLGVEMIPFDRVSLTNYKVDFILDNKKK